MPWIEQQGIRFCLDEVDLHLVQNANVWIDSKGYVSVSEHKLRNRLHRLVMGSPPYKIDHVNTDKTDCRRKNLRPATHSQNLFNRGPAKHNKSGFKGVYLCSFTGRWRAEIRANNVRFKLGRHDTKKEAAMAYDIKAKELHGVFARLNFPEDA